MNLFGFGKPAPAAMAAPPNLDSIRSIWFDLDGTLVDVDMQAFVPAYLARLGRHLAGHADPRALQHVMREAVMQMLQSTSGELLLEELLLHYLERQLAIPARVYRDSLECFCREDLAELAPLVRGHRQSRELLEACLARGWRLVLATNPIFPRAVVEARLAWGDLAGLPFELVTSYESARYCKPHAGFFTDLLAALDLPAEACMMVGNDTQHDLAAGRVGLSTCLLTTWQIDRPGERYPADWRGDHTDFLAMVRGLSGPV